MQESDNSSYVLNLTKDSGTLELDERGYTRFVPSDEERKRIEAHLATEMERAREDYEPLWADAAENIKTYKAIKTQVEGGETILPAPIARIPADQIIARTFNTITRPRPIFSIDPYFKGEYPVVVPTQQAMPVQLPMQMPTNMGGPDMTGGGMGGGMMGQPATPTMQTVAVPVPTDAEIISRYLESGIEFKLREKTDFLNILLKSIGDAVKGCPSYLKIYADQKYKTIKVPKVNGAVLDLTSKEDRRVSKGDVVQWGLVSYFNALMPVDEDDPDESPWFAERTPEDPFTFNSKVITEDYFLVDEEEGDALSRVTTDVYNPFQSDVKESTEKKIAQKPRQKCDVWLVWYDCPVRYVDPEDGQKKIKVLNLCSHFHLGGKRLLDCYINPNDDQSRGYVAVDQMGDGDSTVGILKYFQTVFTHALQAEIKNAFHANNFTYWYDPDGEAAKVFEGTKRLSIGTSVPGKFGEGLDWGVARVGAEHYSLLPLTQFIAALGQQASNVSAYEQGENIPGRTPAATVSQILQQGFEQPILFLRRLNMAFSKALRLYLERTRQYQPMGETLPIRDEKSKAIIEIPFRFPIGEVLDNFRISLTAADEAAAKEHEFEQQAMRLKIFQTFAAFVAQVAGPISNPNATPAQVEFFRATVSAAQKIFDRIIGQDRTDEESFDLAKAVDAIAQERQQAMQIAAEQARMGMMNGAQGQVPQGGGSVPPTPGAPTAGRGPGMVGPPPNQSPNPNAPPAGGEMPSGGM